MHNIHLRRGLDIPLTGAPLQSIHPGAPITEVALVGTDYLGLKPTMLVQPGDQVRLGQPVFTDKKNEGFYFTAPGSGTVTAINRGEKRAFLSLVIRLEDLEPQPFDQARKAYTTQDRDLARSTLQDSGLWTSLQTRPYGKIPRPTSNPSSLFVTAIDTQPLSADPLVLIRQEPELFVAGLKVLNLLTEAPVHLCTRFNADLTGLDLEGIHLWGFAGPHPAGLPSTHIHLIDPVHAEKEVWHISYQDVMAIGHLFLHGVLQTKKVIALAGPGVQKPCLIATQAGASLAELCQEAVQKDQSLRILSGSVLDGRPLAPITGYLGRYHRQVSVITEHDGRAFLGWLQPGSDRFSCTRLFTSALKTHPLFSPLTAMWGGKRAIYPLGVYEKVMPLDIIATQLLKSLAVEDTEKSAELGCLELIEEDLSLCSFVCPGKNEFGPMLRRVLSQIEQGG